MEREACVCDHGYERSDLCAEIIIIIIIIMEMSRLARDGTAEPVSRDQIFRRERRQGNINFPCSADHVQDWQPYPLDPYSCYMYENT